MPVDVGAHFWTVRRARLATKRRASCNVSTPATVWATYSPRLDHVRMVRSRAGFSKKVAVTCDQQLWQEGYPRISTTGKVHTPTQRWHSGKLPTLPFRVKWRA